MIEKVAKALANDISLSTGIILHPDTAREAARAAIEAMREPTEAMCAAGECAGQHAATYWPAMIDAALQRAAK